MKKFIKHIYIWSIASSLLFSTACKKGFVDGYSNDPNSPKQVASAQLLPSAQASMYYTYSSDFARFSSIIMQQQAGNQSQFANYEVYSFKENDLDNAWQNTYVGALEDLHLLSKQAEANGEKYYLGISKVLKAMTLGVLADSFDDIPYTEAFQPEVTIKPKYDTGEEIYAIIIDLLTTAKADLSVAADEAGPSIPGTDDLIYGGDTDKWIKTANVLLARYHNHLSKVDPAKSAQDALAAIDAGAYSSISDNALARFIASSLGGNPWYLFLDNRPLHILMSKTIIDLMNGDPRLSAYATDVDGEYVGQLPGELADDPNNVSVIANLYAAYDASVPLVTYQEAKFIEAEAALRLGQTGRAQTAYSAAVRSSLDYSGVSAAAKKAFLDLNETLPVDPTQALEKIMTQKYVALFTQFEVWTDWRRTGFPDIQPAANAVTPGKVVPRRFPYPLSERLYNGSNLAQTTSGSKPIIEQLVDRVWWDK